MELRTKSINYTQQRPQNLFEVHAAVGTIEVPYVTLVELYDVLFVFQTVTVAYFVNSDLKYDEFLF